MVRKNPDSGEHEIVEERKTGVLLTIGIGRRRYAVSNLWKGIVTMISAALMMGAAIGTILHIIGWDFVSVRGQELDDVRTQIARLHHTDTMQLENQRAQRASLDSIAKSSERTSRYLCYFMRRYEPAALEPSDPCQPVNVQRRVR